MKEILRYISIIPDKRQEWKIMAIKKQMLLLENIKKFCAVFAKQKGFR